MLNLFIKWLLEICKIEKEKIKFEIYIHENSKNNLEKVREYWSKATNYSKSSFDRIYFKKNKIKTNRKNTGSLYFGLLRVKVSASSTLNRRIMGWVKAINNKLLPGSEVVSRLPLKQES